LYDSHRHFVQRQRKEGKEKMQGQGPAIGAS